MRQAQSMFFSALSLSKNVNTVFNAGGLWKPSPQQQTKQFLVLVPNVESWSTSLPTICTNLNCLGGLPTGWAPVGCQMPDSAAWKDNFWKLLHSGYKKQFALVLNETSVLRHYWNHWLVKYVPLCKRWFLILKPLTLGHAHLQENSFVRAVGHTLLMENTTENEPKRRNTKHMTLIKLGKSSLMSAAM